MTTDNKMLLEMADVAKLTGFSIQRVRRILKRTGGAHKLGGRWMTTEKELKEKLPLVFLVEE